MTKAPKFNVGDTVLPTTSSLRVAWGEMTVDSYRTSDGVYICRAARGGKGGFYEHQLNLVKSAELAEPKLDLTKPLQTRGGFPAKYIGVNTDNGKLIFEITRGPSWGRTTVLEYRLPSGKVGLLKNERTPEDIINKPAVVTTVFRNMYDDAAFGKTAHKAFSTAQYAAKTGKTRIGMLEITLTDGVQTGVKVRLCEPHKRENGKHSSV